MIFTLYRVLLLKAPFRKAAIQRSTPPSFAILDLRVQIWLSRLWVNYFFSLGLKPHILNAANDSYLVVFLGDLNRNASKTLSTPSEAHSTVLISVIIVVGQLFNPLSSHSLQKI